ncbi:DNA replication/repair protein RecF [Nitratireductor aquimarinus]|uniref:DNA replication/repair protein RecF n=1 Tax=Nitratireductor TaxID=245876 RepID=UPI0019D32D85|nr:MULTISPECIES: DNA replication/repair protein RecF [Nitratireductor]MBN7761484.1 DNA replication/repair protein RecF [Nitratireductor aquibiodomus]MBN8243378.1 DNA replication/repair protein RecF [Nitratireductor aquimarinus]MBY6131280.1 DNA replication/repair protein RecF [Nitratireductor aquimarinus]MCA1301964.1 DNA replication/repair protein RecF [Nitratireductor aquimarinus]MCV0381495.1 DNA replication/repair protein RecF [Nitratireductor sp.]
MVEQTSGRQPVAQVHVTRLSLTDFRNYHALALDLAPGAVVLTGENGAGKTNLLEAVSFLSPGRGLRRAKFDDVARVGAETGFAIHARLEGPFGECEIGTGTAGMQPGAETGRRLRINGETARTADAMLEWVRVLWLTPAMDALFTGPAGDRRRFLDRLVLAIDPAHGRRALDYEKAMRARNRLLSEDSRDAGWFDAIETQMAETGVAIAAARAEMVRLLAAMNERLPADGPFPTAEIALEGTIDAEIGRNAAVDVEEMFRRLLRDHRPRDRAAGRTLEGPHRSELLVRHVPKDMPAARCSTGEQKALLVGLILAHARLTGELSGSAPILLLDEISAHFDPDRRAALFSILEELNCQAFMTGTEASLFSAIEGRAQFFSVSAGAIHEPR